jgi:hypothetical protein
MHILKLLKKIGVFRRKLHLWIRKINEDGGQDCFPKLHQYAASLMSSLSHKTCCPFSRNTFRSLLNGLQTTLRKAMWKNFRGPKILSILKLHQNSLRKKKRVSLNSFATTFKQNSLVPISWSFGLRSKMNIQLLVRGFPLPLQHPIYAKPDFHI